VLIRSSFLRLANVALVLLAASLAACSSVKTEAEYPDLERQKTYKNGSLVSDEGGVDVLSKGRKREEDASGIGVNGYLWRAALDTISFMPVLSADPFGGTILTDWYSSADAPGERLKVNVYILDRTLRADGVKVRVFRQVKSAAGDWQDAPTATLTAAKLEDGILTRARELRMLQATSSK
jgi:hypothetical protein